MSEIQLPSHWKVVKLGNEKLATTSSGGTPNRSNPNFFGGDIRWVKSGELDDNWIYDTEEKITQQGLEKSSAKIFPAGTLLLALYGATAGKTAILGVEAATNQAVCAIFPVNESFDSQFIQFYLICIRSQILSARTGGAQPNISQRVIKLLNIILPPLPEQRAIAHILRTIQKAKEARQRELELERERKAALMQYLFTHGTGNEPRQHTKIGEIPKSWQVVKLGDICEIASGGTPSRSNLAYWNGDIPWVKTGEINYNIITDTEEKITKEGLKNSSARMIPAGTLLMAMYGQGVTRGRVAILGIDAAINQACAAIYTSENIITYLLFYFLAYSYENIRNLGHGANQLNLNALLVKLIVITLPLLDEQREIAKVLRACDAKIIALEKEISTLDELFRAMLEELMSGRLSTLPLVEMSV